MFSKITSYQLVAISLVSGFLIMYPDVTWLPFQLEGHKGSAWPNPIPYFLLRYTILTGLVAVLVHTNLNKLRNSSFKKRFGFSLAIAFASYIIYGAIAYSIFRWVIHYGSLVLFQFFMVGLLSSLFGYIVNLYNEKRLRDQQIEELTIKNLQSRYDALTNQINPHFFFNSLNGLTSLIRKKNDQATLTYVDKLSDVFRYILQSDKRGLITLREELVFVESFQYMMEVRFANKLKYTIDIDEAVLDYRLPALSILPVLDNIVVHNRIDTDHKMNVQIHIINDELVVSNPLYPKLTQPSTNGTGLKNLEGRFMLLMGKSIRVEKHENRFSVFLPLNRHL